MTGNSTLRELLSEGQVVFREGRGHRNVRAGWLGVDCPECSPGSGDFVLGIHETKLFANCWRCGPKNLTATLQQLLGIGYREARRAVEALGGAGIAPEAPTKRGKYRPPKCPPGLLRAHRRYLRSRGFDPEEIVRLWNVSGLDYRAGRFAWRLLIPVMFNGDPASWTTRAVDESIQPRYLACPDPERETRPIRSLLYGIDYCRHACIVHEGPADVWRTGPGAVALLGVSVDPRQLWKLARFPVRVVCFDNEKVAQKRAAALCDLLEPFPGETYRVQLDAADPGSAKPKEVRMLRRFLE